MEIDEFTLCWLAGFLEGDAHFGVEATHQKPIIFVKLSDEEVIARLADIFGVKYFATEVQRAQKYGWKQAYTVKTTGQNAVHWMKLVYPLMGQRRREQIDKALANYRGDGRKILDPSRIEALKQRLQAGEPVLTLAQEFGVSKSYAYRLRGRHH